MHTPRRLQRNRHLLQAKTKRKSHSHSLVTIYDLSIGNLAIGDVAIERLAIECLPIGVHFLEGLEVVVPTNFVNVMKRKRIVRSKFSNFGLTTSIFLVDLCQMVSASFFHSSGCKYLFVLVLHEGSPRHLW